MADEATLELIKSTLGYTDSQWEKWKSNPVNMKIVETGSIFEFEKYRVVAEVISSYGCGAQHKVGDRIVFSGGLTLLCKENPDRICASLLQPILPLVSMVFETISNGEKPGTFTFSKVHCGDVGVDHGGWGEVVAEIKVEKIQE
jgi:uncharacterized repeat protein (TIGR04076 family)